MIVVIQRLILSLCLFGLLALCNPKPTIISSTIYELMMKYEVHSQLHNPEYSSVSSCSPGNHEMTQHKHHWCSCLCNLHHWCSCLCNWTWMFTPFPLLWQRADARRHHWPSKETWQIAGWLSWSLLWDQTWQIAGWLSWSLLWDQTCQFSNIWTDSQFLRVELSLKYKIHMTTRVQSRASNSLAVCTLSIVPNTLLKIGLKTYLHVSVATIVGFPLLSLMLQSRCSI